MQFSDHELSFIPFRLIIAVLNIVSLKSRFPFVHTLVIVQILMSRFYRTEHNIAFEDFSFFLSLFVSRFKLCSFPPTLFPGKPVDIIAIKFSKVVDSINVHSSDLDEANCLISVI